MDPFRAAATEEAGVAAVVVADAAGVEVPGRARVGTLATQQKDEDMREERCAAVQEVLLRQHEAAPRGKNGSVAGERGRRERSGFWGGSFFLPRPPVSLNWPVSSPFWSVHGWHR